MLSYIATLIVDELSLVTVIFLMINSGKGNTESYLINSGLSGAGHKCILRPIHFTLFLWEEDKNQILGILS